MTTPRLLVMDLDGTALDAERRLSPVDVAASARLREAGVKVTICTGRLFPGTQWVARELGVVGPVAVMNGCEVLDAETGDTLFGAYVPPAAHPPIRRVLLEHGLSAFLFESRAIHYDAGDDHHARYLGIWSSDTLVRHPDVWGGAPWGLSERVVAVSCAGEVERVERARRALDEVIAEELHTVQFQTHGGHGFVELRRREDKGRAIERLAQWHGCTVDEVVAVGDWINDLPMLTTAGRSFAMAHAHPLVLEVVDEVLEASREGGAIAEVARRVWDL